jgi:hypothetical protein
MSRQWGGAQVLFILPTPSLPSPREGSHSQLQSSCHTETPHLIV